MPAPPTRPPYGFDDQLTAVLEARPPVISFTFNMLPLDALRRIRRLQDLHAVRRRAGDGAVPEEATGGKDA